MNSIPRGGAAALSGGPDLAKFNSLPRERPGARLGLRSRLTERLGDESDGNISAPELPAQVRDLRNRMVAPSPSIFTSDEYRVIIFKYSPGSFDSLGQKNLIWYRISHAFHMSMFHFSKLIRFRLIKNFNIFRIFSGMASTCPQ